MSQLFIPSSPDAARLDHHQHDTYHHFQASTNHVAHLADILSTITQVNHQALMIVSESGITFYSEYNHITNVHLTIDASLFSNYDLQLPLDLDSRQECRDMRIGVDVQLISDSFSAAAATVASKSKSSTTSFSSAADVVCFIKYEGEGHSLVIEFEDRLMSEKIEFATFYTDFEYPYDPDAGDDGNALLVDHEAIQMEIIVKSDLLANLLQDLQHVNTEDLFLFASNGERPGKGSQNQLNFISRGDIGYLKLLFPSARTMLEKLEIYTQERGEMVPCKGTVLACFAFLPFIKIFRAVKLSSKCKITKDSSGVLSLQLLCKNPAVANYLGSLITFNMLERTGHDGEFDRPAPLDVNNIFDDDLYHHIKDYDPMANDAAQTPKPMAGPIEQPAQAESLSFSSFKKRAAPEQQLDLQGQKRQRDDDDNEEQEVSINGAVEIPIFL